MIKFDQNIYGKPTFTGMVPGSVNLKLFVYKTKEEASRAGANILIEKAKKAKEENRLISMIIPTGNSPIQTYKICVDEYNSGNISFSSVNFRSMDEYEGTTKYQDFIKYHIMNAVDANSYDIFDAKSENPEKECLRYEEGIDLENLELLLGGTGEEGHLAFNEGAKFVRTVCHREKLSDSTKIANAFDFDESEFPDYAYTIGFRAMFKAKKAVVYAFGDKKISAVSKAVTGCVDPTYPISFMQLMPDADLIMDEAAAAEVIRSGMVDRI